MQPLAILLPLVSVLLLLYEVNTITERHVKEFTLFQETILKRIDGLTGFCGKSPEVNWTRPAGAYCPIEGEGNATTLRIATGYDAKLGEFPSYVNLTCKNNKNGSVKIYCGGVLVDRDIVLTAAHCINDTFDACRARMGFVNENETEHLVTEYAWGYCKLPGAVDEPNSLRYDIALIQLRNPIQYNNYIQPACLGVIENHRDNATCYAVGMGKFANKGNSSRALKVLPMKRKCEDKFNGFPDISCYEPDPGQPLQGNICKGDDGGAMYCVDQCNGTTRQYVVGVASYSPEKCTPRKVTPSFYSDFFKLKDGLMQILEKCYEFH